MVGGVNYHNSQFNRVTQALRQPGSTFKLFVYLTAIQHGFLPDDLIKDEKIKIGDWVPENHDKKTYGDVSIRQAFAKSLNLASINLAKRVSVSNIIKTAKKLGITSDLKNDLSIALGTSEVRLIDLAAAYATIANGGLSVRPYTIEEVYSNNGFQLYQRTIDTDLRVLNEEHSVFMKKLLREVMKTGTGRKANINRDAYGKTGTSQDSRDAWFIGFDDNLICAVWVGNDDNSPMSNIYGSGLPAKIWQKIMQ